MKRISVATDGSEGSDRAIDYAAAMAKDANADLLIVNVIGGYGLPGEVLLRFSQPQTVWLEEMLNAHSAAVLTKARERGRGADQGQGTCASTGRRDSRDRVADWRRGAHAHGYSQGARRQRDRGWQAWGRRNRGAVSWKRRPEAGQPGELRSHRRAMTISRQRAVRSLTAPTCRCWLPHRRLIAD